MRRIVLRWSWTVVLIHRSKFWRGNLVVGDPLKIDDGKEDKENKTSASFPKSSFEKLLRAQTLELTADDNRGSQVVMQFDLPDPTPVEQTCDVDVHNK